MLTKTWSRCPLNQHYFRSKPPLRNTPLSRHTQEKYCKTWGSNSQCKMQQKQNNVLLCSPSVCALEQSLDGQLLGTVWKQASLLLHIFYYLQFFGQVSWLQLMSAFCNHDCLPSHPTLWWKKSAVVQLVYTSDSWVAFFHFSSCLHHFMMLFIHNVTLSICYPWSWILILDLLNMTDTSWRKWYSGSCCFVITSQGEWTLLWELYRHRACLESTQDWWQIATLGSFLPAAGNSTLWTQYLNFWQCENPEILICWQKNLLFVILMLLYLDMVIINYRNKREFAVNKHSELWILGKL